MIHNLLGLILANAGKTTYTVVEGNVNETEEKKIRQFSERTEESIDLPMAYEERITRLGS